MATNNFEALNREDKKNLIAYRTISPADFFFCKKYSYGDALY